MNVPESIRAYFRKLAKEGDYPRKGGEARRDSLTPEERSAIARAAGLASAEARKKEKKKGKK